MIKLPASTNNKQSELLLSCVKVEIIEMLSVRVMWHEGLGGSRCRFSDLELFFNNNFP